MVSYYLSFSLFFAGIFLVVAYSPEDPVINLYFLGGIAIGVTLIRWGVREGTVLLVSSLAFFLLFFLPPNEVRFYGLAVLLGFCSGICVLRWFTSTAELWGGLRRLVRKYPSVLGAILLVPVLLYQSLSSILVAGFFFLLLRKFCDKRVTALSLALGGSFFLLLSIYFYAVQVIFLVEDYPLVGILLLRSLFGLALSFLAFSAFSLEQKTDDS